MNSKNSRILTAFSLSLALATPAFAEPGITDSEIILGSTGVMSGMDKDYGTQLCAGATAYFNQLNQSGGVGGKKVRLICKDDQYEPKNSLENAKHLVEKENIFALIGGNGTPNARAIIPYLEKDGVPYLFPYTGADTLRKPVIPILFHLRISYSQEAATLIKLATEKLNKTKIAVFYQDDTFGTSGLAGVQAELQKYSLNIFSRGSYKRMTADVDAAVETISKSNAEVVYFQSTTVPAAAFIKKAANQGFNPIYLVPSVVGTQKIAAALKEAGVSNATIYSSEVVPLPSSTQFQLVSDFNRDMKVSSQQGQISSLSLEGYTGAAIVGMGLKGCEKTLTRSCLHDYLERLKNINLGGLNVSFSRDNHQAFSKGFLNKIEKGMISAFSND